MRGYPPPRRSNYVHAPRVRWSQHDGDVVVYPHLLQLYGDRHSCVELARISVNVQARPSSSSATRSRHLARCQIDPAAVKTVQAGTAGICSDEVPLKDDVFPEDPRGYCFQLEERSVPLEFVKP